MSFVAVVCNYAASNLKATLSALNALIRLIQNLNYQVIIEPQLTHITGLMDNHNADYGLINSTALQVSSISADANLIIVLGGDGTMLNAVRRLAPLGVPFIGINLGRLGFMTDIALADIDSILPKMLAGAYESEARILLIAKVERDGKEIFSASALNDVVVNKSSTGGMVELGVSVAGKFMHHQRSDGLIVATPTGSTAYALAVGGPILHPSLDGIVLAPIAPHSLSNRPIVLGQDSVISIEIISKQTALVNFDMQSLTQLQSGDLVIVRRSDYVAIFLHPAGHNYFATLREKLRWYDTL